MQLREINCLPRRKFRATHPALCGRSFPPKRQDIRAQNFCMHTNKPSLLIHLTTLKPKHARPLRPCPPLQAAQPLYCGSTRVAEPSRACAPWRNCVAGGVAQSYPRTREACAGEAHAHLTAYVSEGVAQKYRDFVLYLQHNILGARQNRSGTSYRPNTPCPLWGHFPHPQHLCSCA